MQGVEQLPLVSMQTLSLDVKDGIRIDLDAAAVFDQLRQDFLALTLDLQKLILNRRIINILHQLFNFVEIILIALADQLVKQFPQLRVGVQQPAAVRDAVGLVIELIRVHGQSRGTDR
ncbi:MAG: hypothetical protein ACLVJ6_02755 [Merdibacter sp.]